MKYLAVAIALATVLLLSGLVGVAYGDGSNDGSATGYNIFNTTSNGIANFTVHINSQTIKVFDYFNISGISDSLDLPFVSYNKMMPLYWQGTGTVSIAPALSFSTVGSMVYSGVPLQFVYFYESNYLGILFTNGLVSESGDHILIGNSTGLQTTTITYVNSPLSQYNFSMNSFSNTGDYYSGKYSSFTFTLGEIYNYSLTNRQSSISVISSISSTRTMDLALTMSTFATPRATSAFASDGLFPLVYLSGIDSTISITLTQGFHFDYTGGDYLENGGSFDEPAINWGSAMFREHIFKIENGFRTLGYIDVYGKGSIMGSTLTVNSPMSFVLIRFLPSVRSTAVPVQGNGNLGNATTEIIVDNGAYFVPFSPNITSKNISFSNGVLDLEFIQNGTQQFVVVIQGNYTVSSFRITGPGGNSTNYTVTRGSNETIVSFVANGNGTRSLTLSILPYTSYINGSEFPFIALVTSSIALVGLAGGSIALSWKRRGGNLKKNN